MNDGVLWISEESAKWLEEKLKENEKNIENVKQREDLRFNNLT